MHYTRLALGLKFPHRRAFVQRPQGGPCWSPGIPVLQRNPNCSLCRGLPPGPIGAIVGIRARPDPVAGRRLVHQRVEPISVPRAEAVQYPVVLPCGVSEVGPGLLTSGDYRSDMIPASRCGCCMWSCGRSSGCSLSCRSSGPRRSSSLCCATRPPSWPDQYVELW